ncbi:MAG: GNAT family protein [Anaerolineae bacterium]
MDKKLLDLPTTLETQRLIVRRYAPGDARLPGHVPEQPRPPAALRSREPRARRRDTGAGGSTRARVLRRLERADGVLSGRGRRRAAFAAQIYLGVDNWRLPESSSAISPITPTRGTASSPSGARRAGLHLRASARPARAAVVSRDQHTKLAVAERLGFVREGYLRETNNWILLPDGGLSGDYVYGLLRREFEAQQEQP